ncbi:MAG TPA: DUF6491 family protein [Azospirillaceae bacterium]|nr:DUF6491 family protein [Azospirillaceae bacterium]
MMRAARPASLALLLAATAACAPVAPAAQAVASADPVMECVEVARVNGWAITPDGIVLRARASEEYLVRVGPPASTLAAEAKIALVPDTAGRLCRASGRIVADGRPLNVRAIERIS